MIFPDNSNLPAIRIGTDINCSWPILREGSPYDLTGRKLALYLCPENQRPILIHSFHTESNLVIFDYLGKDQKVCGGYFATLIENPGETGMLTLDSNPGFALVNHSSKAAPGTSALNPVSISLQPGDIIKGIKGDPAGFGEVTAVLDSNPGEPSVDVQTSGPDTAKNFAFTFHGLAKEVYAVTYNTTRFADIVAENNKGKLIYCDYNNIRYYLFSINGNNGAYFYAIMPSSGGTMTFSGFLVSLNDSYHVQPNIWTGNLELNTNKVQTIAEYENKTAKYPSTKAVADYTKANVSSFRGIYQTLGSVPSNPNEYPLDAYGNKKPNNNDYMVVSGLDWYEFDYEFQYQGGDIAIGDDYHLYRCKLSFVEEDYPQDDPSGDSTHWERWIDAIEYVEDAPTSLTGSWRFHYQGNWDTDGVTGWRHEYQVSEDPLDDEQLAALNSGITGSKVAKLDEIEDGAEVNVQSDWEQTDSDAEDYIKNKPTIPDISGKADKDTTAVAGNLAKFDEYGNPIDAGVKASDFAKVEDFMLADGLIDTRSAGTAQEFVYRASGGDGYAYMKKLKGKTLVWNQLVNFTDASSLSDKGISVDISNNKLHVHGTKDTEGSMYISLPTVVLVKYISGHRYYINCPTESDSKFKTQIVGTNSNPQFYSPTIFTANSAGSGNVILRSSGSIGTVIDWTGYINIFDLTLVFGDGKEPSTVAEFEALYPELYYAACAGKLVNNDAASIETVGFNQWDEVWESGVYSTTTGAKMSGNGLRNTNPIPAFPSTTYGVAMSSGYIVPLCYDADGRLISNIGAKSNGQTFTTPANTRFICFYTLNQSSLTYQNDICINISDASRNGTYESYRKDTLPLNLTSLTGKLLDGQGQPTGESELICPEGLRSANSVYVDYLVAENGYFTKYVRNVKQVDMGTLLWTAFSGVSNAFQSSALQDKAYGVSNLLCAEYAPTTETVANMPNLSIKGNAAGVYIYAKNTSCATPAAFTTAVAGVKLNYRLATPKVYLLDTPVKCYYPVDEDGTEQAIFPVHADGTPSAPFCADTNYSISIAKLVRKLNA